MKNVFQKVFLPLIVLGSSLFATVKEEKLVLPAYNHRMMVLYPAHPGYEYAPNEGMYFAIDLNGTDSLAWNRHNRRYTTVLIDLQARVGRSMLFNGQDHVRPFGGIGLLQDTHERKFTDFCPYHREWHTFSTKKHPLISYVLLGFSWERDFNTVFSAGLIVKALAGVPVEKESRLDKSFYAGGEVGIPLTFHAGSAGNWEIRLEPFFLALNDGTKYLGHRSAIGYRF